MEFKGTKGEWYVVSSEPAEISTDQRTICFLSIQDYHNKDIQQIANAKLIAAAPELLEALMSIENDNNTIPKSIWDMRNKAIKKALE